MRAGVIIKQKDSEGTCFPRLEAVKQERNAKTLSSRRHHHHVVKTSEGKLPVGQILHGF